VISDDQQDAREGQAWRNGVAERFVVPLKPGNSGGGKGPQFKTDAQSEQGPGDWATYQLRTAFAYAQCRSNKGAPGVDGQDFADIEAYGVERWLGELALALKQESYKPWRIVAHPTVADCMGAPKQVPLIQRL
jgi:hypothetical protein